MGADELKGKIIDAYLSPLDDLNIAMPETGALRGWLRRDIRDDD